MEARRVLLQQQLETAKTNEERAAVAWKLQQIEKQLSRKASASTAEQKDVPEMTAVAQQQWECPLCIVTCSEATCSRCGMVDPSSKSTVQVTKSSPQNVHPQGAPTREAKWTCTTCSTDNAGTRRACRGCGEFMWGGISLDEMNQDETSVQCPQCQEWYGRDVFESHLQGHIALDTMDMASGAIEVYRQRIDLIRSKIGASRVKKEKTWTPKNADREWSKSPLAVYWQDIPKGRDGSLVPVPSNTEEYYKVAGFFMSTLIGNGGMATVAALERVISRDAWARFQVRTARCAKKQMMFHGCRNLGNENSIIKGGFKVSECLSGGRNFGTWFAYNASYSDGGFAFEDRKIRHMFICVVAAVDVSYQTDWCRVVGQDNAYPLYRILYYHGRGKP